MSNDSAAEMVHAYQYARYGTPAEVLKLEAVAKPKCGPSEVLLKPSVLSLNPIDLKVMGGNYENLTSKLPFVPGYEAAGVVVETGPAVMHLAPGDRVVYFASMTKAGACSELIAAPAANVVRLPEDVSFEHAASLGIAAGAAQNALENEAVLKAGQYLLIINGAGAVGSYATQLAKHIGAHVTVTCSEANIEYCKSLGADETASRDNWSTDLRGRKFNVVFECANTMAYETCIAESIIDQKGTFVTVTSWATENKVEVKDAMVVGFETVGRKLAGVFADKPKYSFFVITADGARLKRAVNLVAAGKIGGDKVIFKTVDWKNLVDGAEELRAGHCHGKILVKLN